MNKIVASLGMVALGASGIQFAQAQGLSTPPQKPWNISASLRGFYDDNVSTVPSGPNKVDTLGFELAPGVGINWGNDMTKLQLSYLFSLKYYDKKPFGSTDHYDKDHNFDAALNHTFNDRFQLGLKDSFVVGQEPDALRSGFFNTVQRISGENIRNNGQIVLEAQMTPLLGTEIGYGNTFYDYADSFSLLKNVDNSFNVIPSSSGALDRIEHLIHIDLDYQLSPETVLLGGYQFGLVDYTADEQVGGPYPPPEASDGVYSKERDNRSHFIYGGINHVFIPELTGSLKAGVQITDYYNDPNYSSSVGPYVQASLHYNYAEESFVEAGFSQAKSPSDLIDPTAKSFVRDTDASVLYATVNNRFTPHIHGSVTGTFQNASFNGGEFDGKSEQFFELGLNLKYVFTRYVSAEIGYNYDHLNSDVPNRGYDRNRVYTGISATY